MRPTYLQFRSPDESTSEIYYPTVNNQGFSLKLLPAKSIKPSKEHPTFTLARRFTHYTDLEKRTTNFVGPGSYNSHTAKVKLLAKNCMAKYVFFELI